MPVGDRDDGHGGNSQEDADDSSQLDTGQHGDDHRQRVEVNAVANQTGVHDVVLDDPQDCEKPADPGKPS
jgi:hypothetical protein